MSFEQARTIADAVLYEGYLLYPYRRSAAKNHTRWQFGTLVPHGAAVGVGSEPSYLQTECLIEAGKAPALHIKIRFLQLQTRSVQATGDASDSLFYPVDKLKVDGREILSWDEAVEREYEQAAIDLDHNPLSSREFAFFFPGGQDIEPVHDSTGRLMGRIIRERWPVEGKISVSVQTLGRLVKIRARVENLSAIEQSTDLRFRFGPDPSRTKNQSAEIDSSSLAIEACSRPQPNALSADSFGRLLTLRRSFLATHTLLAIRDGAFVSLIDPPEWARTAASSCENLHAWPVLIGAQGYRDTVLSAPIILYDYPQVAPESSGDHFDLTEIDELLTLRIMTLTEDEKREARETDPRAAAILGRIDGLPNDALGRLHGAARDWSSAPDSRIACDALAREFAFDAAAPSETDHVLIDGIPVKKGSRLVLQPGARRTDAQDMFLTGRTAMVEAICSDLEGRIYLAVTLIDDPAADLHRLQKRFLYFYPDEVELPASASVVAVRQT